MIRETPSAIPATPTPAGIAGPLVDAPQLTSIHMLDETNGWGITETALVRTDDGGTTWHNLTPPALSPVGYSVRAHFLDVDHAWLLSPGTADPMHSGTLYRTSDGGLTWTSVLVPFGGGSFDFLDASSGWILADLGAGMGSNAVAVFQTVDGGATWAQTYVNEPNAEGASDSLPLGGMKGGIVALNMQTAWVGGVIYVPGTVYLYRTDDGGHTWAAVSLLLPDNTEDAELSFEDLQFVDAKHAFLTVRVFGDTSSQLAVYVSDDAGATWTLTPTLIPEGGAADFISSQEGVVWSGAQFYVTRDAAQTWETVPPDVLFGDMFAQMDFVSAQTGWVITYDTTSHYSLYKTTDSGATWLPLFQ